MAKLVVMTCLDIAERISAVVAMIHTQVQEGRVGKILTGHFGSRPVNFFPHPPTTERRTDLHEPTHLGTRPFCTQLDLAAVLGDAGVLRGPG